MSVELTPEQRAAVEQRDTGLFVHANAGSGKTRVLVERFVRAVVDDGVAVDRILAITFTEKAAAELKARLRRRFLELGERGHARKAEGAWVSTIHGFCSKLLRRHALLAGIDPEYEVLDETQAARLAIDSFDRALEGFLDPGEPARLDLAAAHTPDRLRRMVTTVHAKRRSAGEAAPALPEIDEPGLGEERGGLEAALANALVELGEHAGVSRVDDAIAKLERCGDALAAVPDGEVGDPAAFAGFVVKPGRTRALLGPRMTAAGDALQAWIAACAAQRGYRDYVLLRELLAAYTSTYAAAKERISALDFEDLELIACRVLEDNPALRERYERQFEHVLVDEFQDTNRLQIRLLDLLTGRGGRLFTVGDEFQSIYGFRHADLEVFRERRAQASTLLALTRNYRSRPQVLEAVNHLFGDAFGDDYQPLAASAEFADPVFGHPVELLVTDKPSFAETKEHWRAGEAQRIAGRVRELVDSGEAEPGEIVVLFAAGT
ncbi:MAG TPA: UvrD-helicase domain-containing protein, partial [Thermoleophilaceae bacterium]|nr:UvrD-helicase domain-containing protein [Thermoleophilaceae bacterium]